MTRIPLRPAQPERTAGGATDKYCPADHLACGNGTIRTAHPCELFGDDWLEWSLRDRACKPVASLAGPGQMLQHPPAGLRSF